MNPAPNFDHLARVYRWMEVASFGPALWRCRCHFLGEVRECRSALVLGDGDGRFTAQLLEINPKIEIDAVDASPAMLRALEARAVVGRERLRTHCADVRVWEAAGHRYDLVVSHFFLDCLTTTEVAELARRLRPSLSPQALWLISEFAVPESRFGRLVAKPIVSGLYAAFRLLAGVRVQQLPNYAEAISKQGFRCECKQALLGGGLVTEVWSAAPDKLLQSC
jgi:trans-aconitate methyltransferase